MTTSKTYEAGETVEFAVQFETISRAAFDRLLKTGDKVFVRVYRAWNEEDGMGEGGPFGWGGYTDDTLFRIGEVLDTERTWIVEDGYCKSCGSYFDGADWHDNELFPHIHDGAALECHSCEALGMTNKEETR
jgi:hypothetical protein